MLVAVVALAAIAALVLPPGHDDESVDQGDCNEVVPKKRCRLATGKTRFSRSGPFRS